VGDESKIGARGPKEGKIAAQGRWVRAIPSQILLPQIKKGKTWGVLRGEKNRSRGNQMKK